MWSSIAAFLPLVSGWVLAPLRLFLGVTFLYAGIQKLTDPQFFNPHASGYIGRQILAFAHGSPIRGLLLSIVLPHATFYGGLIAYGEIAIGLGTLVGFLARPAAAFGLLLSLVFFLSASWNVHPYFYGADIVFVFAWLTLGLQPRAGLPNLDARVAAWLALRQPRWMAEHPVAVALVLSIPEAPVTRQPSSSAGQAPVAAVVRGQGRRPARQLARQACRREFLVGLGAGVAGTLGLVWLWGTLHPTPSSSTGGSGMSSLPTVASGATRSGTTGASANVIAHTSDVPSNSAATFTLQSTGDPGVLVHLEDGRFVAFDATCTHAGCPVQYDAASHDLYCPCHGAVFDPANNATVLQGPADTPLTPVPVTVQSNGDITLA
jgi:thiosulfate dehydrogenase [quinone] large subunit